MWLHTGVYGHCKSVCTRLTLGEKIPCHTRKTNLPHQCANLMLYQLSYIPTPTTTCLGPLGATTGSYLWWGMRKKEQRTEGGGGGGDNEPLDRHTLDFSFSLAWWTVMLSPFRRLTVATIVRPPQKKTPNYYHGNVATADELGDILEQTVTAVVCFQCASFQNDCNCLKNLFPHIALKAATLGKGVC